MFRLDSLDLLKCYLYVSEAKNMGGGGGGGGIRSNETR